ncbi:MAG: DUF411 domain-containing protein, partial [Candidatus Caldarchaeum sp.]|nr:DUF411 domain-containing protein [Candidatus Caldarchaeum sp.]
MRKPLLLLGLLLAAAVSISLISTTWNTSQSKTASQEQHQLIIYRTETCSCCKEYEAYLRNNGLSVRTVIVSNHELNNVRKRLGVPQELLSCHTAQAGPYFIEGHVPLEIIRKLLREKPAVDGIALPGMPSGSPG